MKPKHFLLPVFTGLIATAWLFSQRHSIADLEKENADLEKRIAARPSHASPVSSRNRSGQTVSTSEKLDWKEVANLFEEMERNGGMTDMRSMIRVQQRLQALTTDEILATFDEINAIDLPEDSQKRLEQILLNFLIQKDPELALNRFSDYLSSGNSQIGFSLVHGLFMLAEKDPEKAVAWLDRQIADGKFESTSLDGKNQLRLEFEGIMISKLLSVDPSAAGRRLALLPLDQKTEAIEKLGRRTIEEKDQLAFASLVRDQLPEKDQVNVLTNALSIKSTEDLSKATDYLNRIEATPTERSAIVEKVTAGQIFSLDRNQNITIEAIDKIRDWATSQSSNSADLAIGKGLAYLAQSHAQTGFAKAAELAVHYHETTGNDIILMTFLESWGAKNNRDSSLILAEKIKDPEQRARILKRFKNLK